MTKYTHLFQDTSFSSKSPKKIQILKDHLFCINTDGMIEKIVAPEDSDYQPLLDTYQDTNNFHRLADMGCSNYRCEMSNRQTANIQ